MVYNKERYQKNREKMLQQSKDWNKNHRDQINETRKKWRHGKGKEKNRISKTKSDAKYHSKKKQDPEYVEHRRIIAENYNHREDIKSHRVIIQAKHRAIPEVKKSNAEYNSGWAKRNPDKCLANIKRGINKLAKLLDMTPALFQTRRRAWSGIIHRDFKQKCAVCGKPSKEAHHVIHQLKYPFLSFNRTMGVALCYTCHDQAHGKMLEIQVV